VTPRQKTLAQIEAQSEQEHSRLLRGKEDGFIFYDPNPADIYVYRLQVVDQTEAYQTLKHEMLFATHEYAELYAIESIRKRYLDIPGFNKELEVMYVDGKYQELINFVSDRLAYRQTISLVQVRT
jgi:hypothetical protein